MNALLLRDTRNAIEQVLVHAQKAKKRLQDNPDYDDVVAAMDDLSQTQEWQNESTRYLQQLQEQDGSILNGDLQ